MDITAYLGQIVEDGDATVGSADDVKQTIDKFYPKWNPTPIDDMILD